MLIHKQKTNNMNIIHIGNPVLSQEARVVTDINNADTQTLIDDMFATMRAEKGVGLAAPQVNVSKRIVVIEVNGQEFVFINPQITHYSQEQILFTEGCLSIPGKEFPIIRYQKVTINYLDRNAKECVLKTDDLLAVVCQHEIDHLNGILMTDRYKQQVNLRKTLNVT